MEPKCVELPRNGGSIHVSMGDFELVTPNGEHRVELLYRGEPPHGDSYHEVFIDRVSLPGYAWGCNFACTDDSRYLAFSWMARRIERITAVVDMADRKYVLLPAYIYDFVFQWPRLEGVGRLSAGLSFDFAGAEHWLSY